MTSPVFFIPEIESSLSDDITTDIANYAYVWYTKENPLTKVSQEDLDKIHEIIINYSYPCYLGNGSIRGLAPDDKKKIIYQELLFIREKIFLRQNLPQKRERESPRERERVLNCFYQKLLNFFYHCFYQKLKL